MFWIVLWLLSLVWIIVSGAISWSSWWFSGGLIGIILLTIPLVWWGLAPRNLFFTFVEEGTAKAVMRGATTKKVTTPEGKVYKVTKGGQLRRVLIQWEGYTLDRESNVVEGRERWHPFGGLRYYGFWPFAQIYTYLFEWTGVAENGEVQSHPKEKLDYILLKDDVYWAKVENAEDKELLPLNVEVILTQRVVNPRKALFAVQSWLETIINRTKPAVRDSVTTEGYKELISKTKAIGEEIYKELEKELLREEFRDRYGIDVRKLEVKEINPREDYRDATLKKWLGQQEAEARATATAGTLFEMITEQTGMSREDIRKMLKENPKDFIAKYGDLLKQNLDLIQRRMAIDGRSFVDIRVDGAKGGERSFLNLIAAWLRMAMGGKEEEEPSEPKEEETEEGKGKKFFEKIAKESKEHLAKK